MKTTNPVANTAIILTVLLAWFIWTRFDVQESRLRAEQSQFLATQPYHSEMDGMERVAAARRKSVEMENAWAQEKIMVLGGPVAAAAKDPALDIRQMLQHIATACTPANTTVSVTVDRFTEFDIAMTLPESLSFTRLAQIAKCLLTNGVPYVSSIRFIQADQVLAQLDNGAIESVTNWNAASDASVRALLLASETQSHATTTVAATEAGGIPASNADLSPEQINIKAAQNTFKQHYDEHARLLNELVTELNRSAQLDALQSQDQLQARIASLDQFAASLVIEREFFMNQSAYMERLLNRQGEDPLIINIITRKLDDQNQSEVDLMAKLFDDLSKYQQQTQAFLTILKNYWGEWAVHEYTHNVQFKTLAAHDAYTTALGDLQTDVRQVQLDFQFWANHREAGK